MKHRIGSGFCLLLFCMATVFAGAGRALPAQATDQAVLRQPAAFVTLAGGTPASPPALGNAAASTPAAPGCYFEHLIDSAIASWGLTGSETPFEEVRAAFLYVICRTNFAPFAQPELTEAWRHADRCGQPPTVYEVMAAGPLEYGIGECEHYAAALIVLLQRMGYEALYVPGLTYSVQGVLVDHAWVMVKIEGNWYHIDPQLEDNVVRDGTVFYRYYLKSDEDFAAHHVWGTRLSAPGEYAKSLPACARSAAAPDPEAITQQPMPGTAQLLQKAAAIRSEGSLEPCPFSPTGTLPPLPGEEPPAESV